MNFIEATHAAKEGKKIRRECWESPWYLFFEDKQHLKFYRFGECLGGIAANVTLFDYLATDWEIVSEKKELSREDLERAWNKFICTEEREFTKAEFSMSFGYFCKELGL